MEKGNKVFYERASYLKISEIDLYIDSSICKINAIRKIKIKINKPFWLLDGLKCATEMIFIVCCFCFRWIWMNFVFRQHPGTITFKISKCIIIIMCERDREEINDKTRELEYLCLLLSMSIKWISTITIYLSYFLDFIVSFFPLLNSSLKMSFQIKISGSKKCCMYSVEYWRKIKSKWMQWPINTFYSFTINYHLFISIYFDSLFCWNLFSFFCVTSSSSLMRINSNCEWSLDLWSFRISLTAAWFCYSLKYCFSLSSISAFFLFFSLHF